MKKISYYVIGRSKGSDRDNFIWNMAGSSIYAIASMILTYLTIRVIGDEYGGIFSIGLTISQMLVYFAYFEMRTFQVTDSRNKYTFYDYYTTKLVTCPTMILVSLFYIWTKHYTIEKSILVFLVCMYRLADGFADVFESQFHKNGRLDIAGKSLTFRTIFSVTMYFVVLVMTKNLMYALSVAVISAIVGIWIFNILVYREYGQIHTTKNKKVVFLILKECFPLFLGTFLWTYILSASRLAIDKYMPSQYQSYYQVLFMPVSVINLFAGFVFKPILLTLTNYYAEQKYKEFFKVIGKNIAAMAVFTGVCMVAAYVAGPEVLSFLVNCDLSEYRMLLTFLMLAGGLNAIAVIMYYVLTIIRSNIGIIGGYIIASLLAMILSPIMVKENGMTGAAGSYFIVILVLNIIFVSTIAIYVIGNKRRKGE